jgi:hypothetical protein
MESWLEKVPDKYADMLREGKIDYDQFLELTEQYQPIQTRVLILSNKKNYSKKKHMGLKVMEKVKGLDLIG